MKKILLVVTLLAATFQLTFAQSKSVSGKVTDETGTGMPGASVVVKNTTNGTISDASGQFKLDNVPADAVLSISSIGYSSQEVTVGTQTSVDIKMIVDVTQLSEVVVVGYGSQVKRELTGAVQNVNSNELRDIPVSQVTQKLQGKLAGVQINQTTGKPGQGMNVRIRGQLSVSAGSDPLYVVDGFPITGNIGTMNPDEIEDISILKDAASTALYGSRAANGVVLITTKKGKAGQTNISFGASGGIQTVPMRGRVKMMNAVDFAQFKKESYEDAGQAVPVEFQNPSQYQGMNNNDWYDALIENAPVQNYNLTVTSNSEKTKVAVVGGIFDQKGVVENTGYKRYSLRLNTEYDLSKNVKMGFNVAPTYIYDNTPATDGDRGTGILFNALHTWPIMPIYDANGQLTLYNTFPGSTGNIFNYPNWVRSANEITNENTSTNLLTNAYVQVEPIKGLVLKSTFNAEIRYNKYFFFNPSTATNAINVPVPTTAVSVRENTESLTLLNENTATYSKKFGEHSLEILAGFTTQKFRQDVIRIQADTYTNDQIPTIQGAININRSGGTPATRNEVNEWSLVSLLARLQYNYKGKYIFSASARRDGSSRFGSNNRWGNFPSLSAAWILSDEGFLQGNDYISFAKLRTSFGTVGNNNIGNYTQYALLNNTVNAVFGSTVAAGAAVSSMANSNLGWETTKSFDLGVDLGIIRDRLTFTYDYYRKYTTNLLYNVQVPQEAGFSTYPDNIGQINFWGHEFSVTSKNTTGKLKWTTNANVSVNRNIVKSLAEGIDRVYGNQQFNITQVGKPFGQFYGHISQGMYQNAEDLASSPQVPGRSVVGSIKLTDQNGDGIITNGGDQDDRVIMGNPFPKFLYGITNTMTYANFDFTIVGSGSYGNKLMVRHIYSTANLDGVFNVLDEVKYRFRSPANPGRGKYGTTVGGGNVTGIERDWINSRFIADASFFTIKNVTLGYTIVPKTRFFKSARVYASVQQLYVFTKYWGGPNPETSAQQNGQGDGGNLSPGLDLSNYPVPRTYSLGVNLNF
jgi:TonB-linked SusC/RagA family outer membrane protein